MRKLLMPLLGLLMVAAGCGELELDPTGYRIGKELRQKLDGATKTRVAPSTTVDTGSVPIYFSHVWQAVSANKNNPSNIALECVRCIDSAKRTLDVCCHEIDNQPIVDAIVRAHRRGVVVRVVTETDYMDELGPKTFAKAGIHVISDERSDLMHNKFMVVDGMGVWTGSFNFTDNCAYKNNNNALYIENANLAANFAEKFRWFWEKHKFGGKPTRKDKIPYPVVELTDGTVIETYFAPEDQIDHKLVALLRTAKSSIKFMAFSFTHDEIAGVMLDRASRGVKVAGVFETRQNSKYSKFDRLSRKPNVYVVLDGNKYTMHHKVIIIDDQTVVTGSFNFSANASRGNDENVLVIHSRAVAKSFDEEFTRVVGAANQAVAGEPATVK